MSSDDCSYDLIKNSADPCSYAQTNCTGAYINFYAMHYCTFDEKLYFSLPILLLLSITLFTLVLFCFYLTGNTANKYLSCALTAMSDRLKISQNLAGVTFLAFGNGAPDVISSIVAASSSTNGIEVSIGALNGAGVFVTSFVLASVVWFAGQVKVNQVLFLRDGIIYLLAVGALSLFSWDGKIVLWEAICFFMIYVIYVILAIVQDRYYKNKEQEKSYLIEEDKEKLEHLEEDILNEIIHFDEEGKIKKHQNLDGNENYSLHSKRDDERNEERHYSNHKSHSHHHKSNQHHHLYKSMIQNEKFQESVFSPPCGDNNKMFQFNLSTLRYRLKKLYFHTKEVKYTQLNWLQKIIFFVIDLPFNLLRDLTIPACELDCWNQTFFSMMPATCLIFVVLITQSWDMFFDSTSLLIATPIVVITLMITFKFTTYRNRLPSMFFSLCLFAFVMSIFWIWFISKVLVDILNTIGVILDIPNVFLAMTLLSFGNSVPDLTLNVALSRQGYGEMGIAGSIAGPCFNVLIGLGTSLIQSTISEDHIDFNLFTSENMIIAICTITLALNLVRLLIQGTFLKYTLTRQVSVVGFILYTAFFVLICIYSFKG